MVQVNYVDGRDELEVIFQEVENPEVLKLNNGIFIEFSPTQLSAIILPNFARMINIPIDVVKNATLKFKKFDSESLTVTFNEQNVNIKIDLSEIENS